MRDLEDALKDLRPSREQRQAALDALDPAFYDEDADPVLLALQRLPADLDFDAGAPPPQKKRPAPTPAPAPALPNPPHVSVSQWRT